jgi:hypothetical protein
MTASLSTQLHRALYALPLLAIGLLGVLSIDVAAETTPVVAGSAPTLPNVALVAQLDCGPIPAPAGALALARMPGDLSPIAARVRCAQ